LVASSRKARSTSWQCCALTPVSARLCRIAVAAGESPPGAPSSTAAMRSSRRSLSSADSAGLSAMSSALRAKR